MGKTLERDLGLFAIISISIGAMIGSGIFVLPGLASKIAGPAVIVAYLLAGLIVLPAALSKAEMATAMPESGGTYLFIDRATGPMFGTIAGIGAWFSLVFKSAFALVGLGAYLLLFLSIPSELLVFVALGLGILLLLLNILGAKFTGTFQAGIVTIVLVALGVFIVDGITFVNVSGDSYHPFFSEGVSGLLVATGFVFVSYAGVTKIASIAEEVKNPGKNIPLAILGSVVIMMLVYTMVVFVIIGNAPAKELETTLTPMSLAARQFFGPVGEIGIAIIAVLALTSMANAGVLSSTRYPLAMSRDNLAPDILSRISDRFKTPVFSIAFTGAILLVLIAFVPVVELAKLASAFQILVFSFINIALIAFRESKLESYQPEFTAPGYPWVQIFGIISGFLLITQLGFIPIAGAVGLILLGLVWYRIYGREKTEREGAALDAIRKVSGKYTLRAAEDLYKTGGEGGLLVASDVTSPEPVMDTSIEISHALIKRRGGKMNIVQFQSVPDQVPLSAAAASLSTQDEQFNTMMKEKTEEFDNPVEINQVVSHDIKNSLSSYVDEQKISLLIAEYEPYRYHGRLFKQDVDWYMKHLNSDIIFVRDGGQEEINSITIISKQAPYSPLEIQVADVLGQVFDSSIRFLNFVKTGLNEEQIEAIQSYHDEIDELCISDVEHKIMQTTAWNNILDEVKGCDLVISSTSAHHILVDFMFGSLPDKLMSELNSTVILVHENEPRSTTFLRYVIEKIAY